MNTKQIAVIGVVIVLVIAAVAIVITNTGGNNDNAKIEASLAVSGNVDNDYKIDNEDMKLLDKILNNEVSAENYPLADVNNDGKVDSEDKTYLKDIIDDKAKHVYVTDSSGNVQKVNYPLDNIITVNADMAMLISNLGAVDHVAGYIASKYSVEQTLLKNSDAQFISTGRQVKETQYQKIREIATDLDNKGEEIGAIFYYSDGALGFKEDFEAAGIPILKVYCTSPKSNADAYVTYGYLFGGEYEKKGIDMCQYCYNVYDHIEKTLGDRQKVNCIGLNMVRYICDNESQYADIVRAAGGNHVYTQPGSSSNKVLTHDAIVAYDDKITCMLNFSTEDLIKVDPAELWDNPELDYIKPSAHFENMIFINCSMPIVVRTAYVAEVLYPDLFEGYGDKVFQEFIDKFLPYLNELEGGPLKISEIMTVCTYEDYIASKA